MRLRRTELSTPASNTRMMEKAAASTADLVLLDLEDGVAPNEKVAARGKAIWALKNLDWGRKTRAVRINDLESEYAYQDIITIVEEAGSALELLIVPKVKTAFDVLWVDRLLTLIEKRLRLTRRIGLEVLIEEVEAMICIEEIARSSSRLEALIFGPGDYSASQGMDSRGIEGSVEGYPGDLWHYARNKIAIAARAAGIDAIDGAYADFKNDLGYQQQCLHARTLGFVGKWAIHPNQLPIANLVFSPTPEAIADARRITTAYQEALSQGQGAIALDGKMVDAAIVRSLSTILQKAELLDL
ncbi:HpcH/HpaI aldolase/citrate lyase family protein [Tengunoibacter tsumagoiensis]|uniref:Malyl-CoA lyase n=1 Tax=Tengunoibacter tsumagoiensis TaxID=2014871 RepID=A0A402A3X6_9CHLR|nr:CoA ester lyase [Tengunoibacter tsumagoiensis]GCE13725.1 malyl-CoA lyase [Tengunoibacter tsumagoiensis]